MPSGFVPDTPQKKPPAQPQPRSFKPVPAQPHGFKPEAARESTAGIIDRTVGTDPFGNAARARREAMTSGPSGMASYIGEAPGQRYQSPVSRLIGRGVERGAQVGGAAQNLLTLFGQASERHVARMMSGKATRMDWVQALYPGMMPPYDLGTFVHPNQAQYQRDTDTIAHGLMPGYDKLPGWVKNAAQFAIQMGYDPTTYLGFSGLGRRALTELGERALPGIMRTAQAAETGRYGAIGRAAVSKPMQHLAGKVHGFMTAGGQRPAHMLREGVLRDLRGGGTGAEGVRNYQRAYALSVARGTLEADLQDSLDRGIQGAFKGLSDEDFRSVEDALHDGTIDELTGKLGNVATRVRQFDDAIPYLLGTKQLREKMANEGYQLPDELQRFDPQRPLGIVTSKMRRGNHVPLAHELNAADALDALETQHKGGKISREEYDWRSSRIMAGEPDPGSLTGKFGHVPRQKLSSKNAQFLARKGNARPEAAHLDANGNLPADYLAQRLKTWSRSTWRAAHSYANADLERRMTQLFAPAVTLTKQGSDEVPMSIEEYLSGGGEPSGSRVSSFLDQEGKTNSVLDASGKPIKTYLKKVAKPKISKRTVQRYQDVPAHIKEYYTRDLPDRSETGQALRDLAKGPQAIQGVSRGAMLLSPTQHPLRIASLLLFHDPQALAGAAKNLWRARLGFASPEREAQVFGTGRRAGAVNLKAGTQQTSAFQRAAAATQVGKPIAWWSHQVSNLIWKGVDPSMKQALYDRYIRQGMDPLLAGHAVQKDLVNYEHASPFIRAAAIASWFPTWRTLMPVAVARALIKNPHYFAMAARLFPASVGGVNPGTWLSGGSPYRLGTSAPAEASDLFGTSGGAPFPGARYLRGTLNPLADAAIAGLQSGNQKNFWTDWQPPVEYAADRMTPGLSLTGIGFHETPQQQIAYELGGIEPQRPHSLKDLRQAIIDARGNPQLLQSLRAQYATMSRQDSLHRDELRVKKLLDADPDNPRLQAALDRIHQLQQGAQLQGPAGFTPSSGPSGFVPAH